MASAILFSAARKSDCYFFFFGAAFAAVFFVGPQGPPFGLQAISILLFSVLVTPYHRQPELSIPYGKNQRNLYHHLCPASNDDIFFLSLSSVRKIHDGKKSEENRVVENCENPRTRAVEEEASVSGSESCRSFNFGGLV